MPFVADPPELVGEGLEPQGKQGVGAAGYPLGASGLR
jgi:hypothetical protein